MPELRSSDVQNGGGHVRLFEFLPIDHGTHRRTLTSKQETHGAMFEDRVESSGGMDEKAASAMYGLFYRNVLMPTFQSTEFPWIGTFFPAWWQAMQHIMRRSMEDAASDVHES